MFFITGLPRSRTAWLANFLNWGNTWCWHDGIRGCSSLDEFAKLMEPSEPIDGTTQVGDCDSGLLWIWRAVAARWPEAKWVSVRGDPRRVAESLTKMEPYRGSKGLEPREVQPLLDRLLHEQDELEAALRPLRVPVRAFSTVPDTLHLVRHLGVSWSLERFYQLRYTRVVLDTPRLDAHLGPLASLLTEAGGFPPKGS